MIERAGSATTRNKTDLIKNFQTGSLRISHSTRDRSSALFLQEQLQKQDELIENNPFSHGRPSFYGPSPGHAIKSKDGSFTIEYVPGSEYHGFGTTFFAEETAEYVVKVEAKRRSDSKMGKVESTVSHDLHHEYKNWSEEGGKLCSLTRCQPDCQNEINIVTFEGRIPISGFSNEKVELKKRNDLLQRLLDQQDASCQSDTPPINYLQEGALAPFFVDLSDEVRNKEAASLVDSCSPPSRRFSIVNTVPVSLQHIPSSISNHSLLQGPKDTTKTQKGLKYRKEKYERNGRVYKEHCWRMPGFCGGAEQDAGTVWVNRVMLPKITSSNNTKGTAEHAQVPSFVVQG